MDGKCPTVSSAVQTWAREQLCSVALMHNQARNVCVCDEAEGADIKTTVSHTTLLYLPSFGTAPAVSSICLYLSSWTECDGLLPSEEYATGTKRCNQ